jgi:hypothetical protein
MELLAMEKVKELLSYDPETGIFVWKSTVASHVKKGKPAGSISDQGYRTIMIGGRNYRAHRLAWLFVYGEWPDFEIDHINRDRLDNRIENLRLAGRKENMRNTKRRTDNTSGVKGVYWSRQRNKWIAQIHVAGKHIHLGVYTCKEKARKAYEIAAENIHGEFRGQI